MYLDPLIEQQRQVLLRCARRLVPHATPDDLLQPNDFPLLEADPWTRYEEGVLHGLQMAKAAALADPLPGVVGIEADPLCSCPTEGDPYEGKDSSTLPGSALR